ncbi:MAG: 3D domain-containing protein [Cellulosilyticaceae bacterium]
MKNAGRIALLIVVLFILGTGSITAYQSMSSTIAIIDDGKVTQYETLDINVGDVLTKQNIILGNNDNVKPSLDTKVETGMKIVITRWKPTVSLTVNGLTSIFRTESETVEDVLNSRNIELPEGSFVSVPTTAMVQDGMKIEIKTREVATEIYQEEISYDTKVEMTNSLAAGVEEVEIEGQTGLKEIVVEIVTVGDEIVSETVVTEEVIVEPQTKIIKKGNKNTIVDAATGKVYEYTKELTLEATAYTDIPGDRWEGITATGQPTFVGMVAVDPKVIPLNTILYIEGYGIAIAGDTGGAIKGHDVDLFFDTSKECYSFGRRNKQVYILKDQSIDVRKERKNY